MGCPERPNPLFDEVDPEPEIIEWTGVIFISDTHPSTPQGDAQQTTGLRNACFVYCDEPECGGPGGWLAWFSNNPEHLELGCDHPDNPLAPYL
jgi:hypothetical protein